MAKKVAEIFIETLVNGCKRGHLFIPYMQPFDLLLFRMTSVNPFSESPTTP
jgi:hypothetical protein